MAMTKNEMVERLVALGVVVPQNWGKLSTARAQAFLDAAEKTGTVSHDLTPAAAAAMESLADEPAPKKVISIGGVLGAGIAALGAMLNSALAPTVSVSVAGSIQLSAR